MKILIIRFSSIGDIVLTSPVIRGLRKQYPQAEIHFCTKAKFAGLVSENPAINKIHVLENELMPLIVQLRQEKYEVVLDLHNNLRTWLIKCALWKARKFTFRKLNLAKWILVKFKRNLLPDVHVVDRYMATCSKLGVQYDGLGLDYFFNPNSRLSEAALALLPNTPFAVFVAGGTWATKRLPVEKMRELFSKTTFPLVVLGDQNDGKAVLAAAEGISNRVTDLCGKLGFADSARVLEKASLVISHDTGLMHVAAAFRKPVISIWGNTVPQLGMYPLFPRDFDARFNIMAEVQNLPCRPCSKIGYGRCPKGHFNCMHQQNINQIIQDSEQIIAEFT